MKNYKINDLEWPCCIPHKVFVGDPESCIAVCTLWQPVDEFCQSISNDVLKDLAIVGQLLDPSGLNYMVRNILGNPRIKNLVVCGHDAVLEDKSASTDRVSSRNLLQHFFDQRFSKEVISEYVDGIPFEEVFKIVHHIEMVDCYGGSIEDVEGVLARLTLSSSCSSKASFWTVPKNYPYVVSESKEMPTQRVSTIVADTVVDGYVLLLKNLMNYGVHQERKKYPEGTLCGFSTKVVITKEDPNNLFFEKEHLPPGCNREYLERQYFPQVVGKKIAKGEGYSYGSLIGDQVDYVVSSLLLDINSKDAVISLWDPKIHQNHNDPPCFVFAQALVLGGKLQFICNMRSNNIIKCWPENSFAFRKLQGVIFERLKQIYSNLELGDLIVHSISAQLNLNTQQFKIAERVLEDRKNEKGKRFGYRTVRARYFQRDVVNCFVSLEDNFIVLRIRAKGKVLREYRSKSARGMKNRLNYDGIDFVSDHAMYVGITLAEAEIALRMGLPFEQDKKVPLGVGLDIDKSRGITLAVDFDKVIHEYSDGWKNGEIYGGLMEGAVETLSEFKKMGFYIIIYSTRGNVTSQRKDMEFFLEKYSVPYDVISVGGKPYARCYIDDKALRFVSWGQTFNDILKLKEEW
jgi:hypothetical protein